MSLDIGSRRLARSLALALALLSLVFLLQVTPHGHSNSQDEAACRLCQAAHVSAIPVVCGIVLSVPLVAVGEVAAPNALVSTESFFNHSDPPRTSRGCSVLNSSLDKYSEPASL